MLLPLMSVAQETSDKPKKEKTKHFELWASVGMGNSSELIATQSSPIFQWAFSPFEKDYSEYVSSSYSPLLSTKFGARVSKRVSVGVRCNLQSVVYQYEQNLPSKPHSSTKIYNGNDRYFGQPMIQLGAYGKYMHPIGKLSPFVSAQCSWVHAKAYVLGYDKRKESDLKFDGVGYGVAVGAQYAIIKRLLLTAQAEYTQIEFGNHYSINQKSASVGVLFSF